MNRATAYITFRISGEYFAVAAECICEMMPVPMLASATRLGQGLLGFAFSHGQRIPVFDLGLVLGLNPKRSVRPGRLVIARNSASCSFGFCVDRLTDVIQVHDSEIHGKIIQGHGRNKTVLNPDQLVSGEVLAGLSQ